MTNINGAVDVALDYLGFYQSVIASHVASHSEDTKASLLYQQLEDFFSFIEYGSVPEGFDFSSFKKNFASFFHPDALQSRNFLIDNPDEMFGVVFNEINDAQKSWNSNEPFSFKSPIYDEEEEEYYAQEGQQAQYEYRYTLGDFISDRVNAIFKGIPSSERDYSSIKSRYEKTLTSLQKRINALIQTSKYLKEEEIWHLRQWESDISDASIEEKYMQNLFSLYEKAESIRYGLGELDRAKNERVAFLKPSIEIQCQAWFLARQQYISTYEMLLAEYNSKRKTHSDADFEQLEHEIGIRDNYIRANLGNLDQGYQNIQDDFLLSDKQYLNLDRKSAQLLADFSQANKAYNDYYHNKEKKKKEIKKEVDSSHAKKDQSIKRKIDRTSGKITSLGNKYRTTEQKLEQLIDTYSPLYEEHSKSK